ncbi:hypothetical protein PRZ48_002374 [Zasmidium cellare]|uniref:FAD-binding domain-containing protein n=1 Tax=Zasmidium cellare TaxID=395010 RepID=A0ABR0F606_ZASCE|nr:hypothetical protein PRZ48_002374 [Zasmidium cellare]
MPLTPTEPKKRFSVVVIGGGIGGLAAAIGLRLSGQTVTVIELREKYLGQTGGARQGLNQTANSYTCLYALGLEEPFHKFADNGDHIKMRRYSDGTVIKAIHKKKRYSKLHREDLLRILYERAVEVGVEIITNETFESIEDTQQHVRVQLQSGRTLQPDLVVGADGVHSKVRKSIPSTKDITASPTGDCVFLVNVPKSVMAKQPSTAALYKSGEDPFHFTVGPGRCIVSWTITIRELYHLQICDFQYGDGKAYGLAEKDDSPLVSTFTDMPALRKRWGDFDEAIRTLLDETDVCTKWRIAETPLDMPWCSPTSRIVLIGDAAHTFEPFAGQGASMAIEDATVLSCLIARASQDPSLTLADVATAYESLRRPRVDAIRAMVKANAAIFGLADGEKQAERDRNIGGEGFSVGGEGREEKGAYQGTAKWSTEEAYEFTEGYDAVKEADGYVFGREG